MIRECAGSTQTQCGDPLCEYPICNCIPEDIMNDRDYIADQEADERLREAAPELLAALKALIAEEKRLHCGQPYPGRPHAIMDAADAAVAKAEGR